MEDAVASGENPATQEEKVKKIFGQNLTVLRKKAAMTRGDLAATLNLSAVTIGAYENGGREPSFEKMVAIADLFNVSLDELFGRNNENSEKILFQYRYDRAKQIILLLGNIVGKSESGKVTLFIQATDNFKLNENGVIAPSKVELDDAIIFENQIAFVGFIENLERRALIENKPFSSIFNELTEKLFSDKAAIEKGNKLYRESQSEKFQCQIQLPRSEILNRQ